MDGEQLGLFGHEMPNGRNQEWCWNMFRPYSGFFMEAIRRAEAEWKDGAKKRLRRRLDAKNEASCVMWLAWINLREVLAEHEVASVIPCSDLGILRFDLSELLTVRIKGVNPRWVVHRGKTTQSRRWYSNEPIRGVPDVRLNVGVRLSLGEVMGVRLTWQPSPNYVEWIRPIEEEDGHGTMPFSAAPSGPQAPLIPITPREGKKKQKDKTG